MNDLELCIHQIAPLLGEVRLNEEEMHRRILGTADADLVVFPELALTGYGLRSRVADVAVSLQGDSPYRLPPDAPPVALGLAERGRDELIYNTAVLLHGKRILGLHRKVYLPTYGMFEEGRFFARGRHPPPVVALPSGWRIGLLVCEDFWHPALLYLLAIQGADVALVLAAAAGRGDPGSGQAALFSSPRRWSLLAQAAALQYGMYVVIANRAGVEGGVTFAGESLVVGPTGDVVARAPQARAAVLSASLRHSEVRRSRAPFAHLRDEDPSYLRRALEHLESDPGRGIQPPQGGDRGG